MLPWLYWHCFWLHGCSRRCSILLVFPVSAVYSCASFLQILWWQLVFLGWGCSVLPQSRSILFDCRKAATCCSKAITCRSLGSSLLSLVKARVYDQSFMGSMSFIVVYCSRSATLLSRYAICFSVSAFLMQNDFISSAMSRILFLLHKKIYLVIKSSNFACPQISQLSVFFSSPRSLDSPVNAGKQAQSAVNELWIRKCSTQCQQKRLKIKEIWVFVL